MANDKKDLIEPIDASFDDLVSAVAPRATPLHKLEDEQVFVLTEMVEYSDPGTHDTITFRLDPGTETIWATQAQIAELFQTDVSGVSRHLKSIFADGELDEDSSLQKMQTTNGRPATLYSLDAVISVGYRVNSKAATRFRQWATGIIKAFIEDGYVINDAALRKSPEKLNRLAAELRALRSEEKQVYAKVRECFKISASDYEPSSQQVRTFYALLQDKFLHAVTGQTASKLVLDRADHREDNMGVQTFSGKLPTFAEAKTGKNYLQSEELYRLHLLSEQFLLYAEARALAGQKMTMESLHRQLDRLLTLNDYPVFDGYRDFLRDDAERHARQELTLYKKRMTLESKGIKYDEEALADGEYDDILLEWVQAP